METYQAEVSMRAGSHKALLKAIEARRALVTAVDAFESSVNGAIDIQLAAFKAELTKAAREGLKVARRSVDRNASEYRTLFGNLVNDEDLDRYTEGLKQDLREVVTYGIVSDGVYDFLEEDLRNFGLSVKACDYERLVGWKSTRLQDYDTATGMATLVHSLYHPDRPRNDGYDAEARCSYELWLYGGPTQTVNVTVHWH